MKKVRIIDVAEHAGVSKSTVSQYLNGRFGHMSSDTKARIESSVEALNYVPDRIARSLKSNKTRTIGVVVRDIAGFNTAKILRGMDDFCKKNDYNLLIYNTDFDSKTEKQSLEILRQMRVDGIIITSSGKNYQQLNHYTETGFPIVQFQLEYPETQTHLVSSDYFQAAKDGTQYLIDLGHKKIGFLTQSFEGNNSRSQRYQGYLAALKENEIEHDPNMVLFWERTHGFERSPLSLLNQHQATALFSQHLAISLALLQSLNQAKVMIPSDVSVLGFDEIPMVDMFKVPISVIKQDAYQIGYESAKMLLDLIDNKPRDKKLILPCELIKRDSCRKL